MKIVIFDMDGTLLDSKKDITISVNHVRKVRYKLKPLSEEFIVEAINMQVRNLPKLFYETEIYHEEDKDIFEKHYAIQCTKNLYLYDGIKEMLYTLVDEGVKISVATNAPTQFAKKMLKFLDVDTIFDVIIGADVGTQSKPSPEMLEKILDFYKYNKDEDDAWMIGDNSKDMLSAFNAKIESAFATWGFSPTTEHHCVISHPKEVLEIVL
jgi:phosphoglycolate phosphatase